MTFLHIHARSCRITLNFSNHLSDDFLSALLHSFRDLENYQATFWRIRKNSTKKIIDDAVLLPVEERVLVVDSLLRSLNQPQSEIDRQWAEVAQSRLQELRSSAVAPVSGQDVFARINARFAK